MILSLTLQGPEGSVENRGQSQVFNTSFGTLRMLMNGKSHLSPLLISLFSDRQVEATGQTQIRLSIEEQSDQGLNCF